MRDRSTDAIPSQSKQQPAGNYGTALPLWDHEFRSHRCGDVQAVGVYEPAASPEALDLARLAVR